MMSRRWESWVGSRNNQSQRAGQFLVRNSSRFRIVLATTIQLANSASETPSGLAARVD